MSDFSPDYYRALALTQQHHAEHKTFSGVFSWKQRRRIKPVIERFGVETVLDYGCGKGEQYEMRDAETGQSLVEFWGVDPVKYDPGVPRFAAEPEGRFDLVICIQVLASIPRRDLPAVVDRLYGYARQAIFVAERIKLPRKQIFASMADAMPHGISAEDWLDLLRRPGSGVTLIGAFHKKGPDGWPGWKLVEVNQAPDRFGCGICGTRRADIDQPCPVCG